VLESGVHSAFLPLLSPSSLFVPDAVLRSRTVSIYRWKSIGHARMCRICCHHVDISSRHQLITTSGFRPPSWIYKYRKCHRHGRHGCDLRTKIVGISSQISSCFKVIIGWLWKPPVGTDVTKTCQGIGGLIDCYSVLKHGTGAEVSCGRSVR